MTTSFIYCPVVRIVGLKGSKRPPTFGFNRWDNPFTRTVGRLIG